MKFAVSDLFVVGLGFDLVGAWLLARGLIAKPDVIVMRITSFWGAGMDPASGFAAAEDRVDGSFGVWVLVAGFGLQALGYVLDLAGGSSSAHSTARALTALALLVAGVVVTLGAWRLARPHLLRAVLVEVAHWEATNVTEPPTRRDVANPSALSGFAFAMGERRHDGEGDWDYAKRVFGLTDADLTEPAA